MNLDRTMTIVRAAVAAFAALLVVLLAGVIWNRVVLRNDVSTVVQAAQRSERYSVLAREIDIEATRAAASRAARTLRGRERAAGDVDRTLARLDAGDDAGADPGALRRIRREIDSARRLAALPLSRRDAFRSRVLFARASRGVRAFALAAQRTTTVAADRLKSAQNRGSLALVVLASAIVALFAGVTAGFALVRERFEREHAQDDVPVAIVPPPAPRSDRAPALGKSLAYQQRLGRELALMQHNGGSLALVVFAVDAVAGSAEVDEPRDDDAVAAVLRAVLSALRPGDHSFRLGDDRCAAIMPNALYVDAAAAVDAIRRAGPIQPQGAVVNAGIAIADTQSRYTAMSLHAQAFAALRAAQTSGADGKLRRTEVLGSPAPRTEVSVASAQRQPPASAEASASHDRPRPRPVDLKPFAEPPKVAAVRHLIKDGGLDVVFQPIWDVEKSVSLGFEALVRPPRALGLDGPAEACAIARELGAGPAFDTMCLGEIFDRAGELPPNALLFVNLLPETLQATASPNAALRDLALDAGLLPERVVLEIAGDPIADVGAIATEAKRLRAQGFRLALAACGGGKAQLQLLRQATFDYVKIDRELIVQAGDDPFARTLVAAVISVACAADAFVIAEGIETVEALRFVCHGFTAEQPETARVRGAQGYLLGRPDDAARGIAQGARTALIVRSTARFGNTTQVA